MGTNMTYIEALKHITTTKKGLMDELRSAIDHKYILEFELSGLIQKGQELNRENSWKVTDEAKKLYKVSTLSNNYQLSLIEKAQSFFNGLIVNKKILN